MKILVVSRLKSNNQVSIITQRQMESLQDLGHELVYFTVDKGGLVGYFKAYKKLRKLIKNDDFDVIHAHYSLCGMISDIAGAKHLVVSLMGSDIKKNIFNRIITNYFIRKKWLKIIVKSDHMLTQINRVRKVQNKIIVLPNGVDFNLFKPIDKNEARIQLGWKVEGKIVLFGSNPSRPEKRYEKAEKAINEISSSKIPIELKSLNNVQPKDIPLFLNASDLVLLTSDREGSPNIIKEAMACNVPIVSTNVGDVEKVIGSTSGCIVVQENKVDLISRALFDVLSSKIKQTNGRDGIQWLSNKVIAKKLIDFYEKKV